MIRLNVEAMVALCGAFLPGMVERGSGRVLNVASVSGFMPVPQQATYSASKAFVLTFTEALTIDLHGTGVTATALCPGPVKTEFAGHHRGLAERAFPRTRARGARGDRRARARDACRWSPVPSTRSTRSPAGTPRAGCSSRWRDGSGADAEVTVLITGATGQVGNAIARRLAADGVEVRALVRSPERARVLPEGVEPVFGDVTDAASAARGARRRRDRLPRRRHPGAVAARRRRVRARERRGDPQRRRGGAGGGGGAASSTRARTTCWWGRRVRSFDESVVARRPGATPYQRSKQEADRIVAAAAGPRPARRVPAPRGRVRAGAVPRQGPQRPAAAARAGARRRRCCRGAWRSPTARTWPRATCARRRRPRSASGSCSPSRSSRSRTSRGPSPRPSRARRCRGSCLCRSPGPSRPWGRGWHG